MKAANLLKTPITRIGYGIGCLFLIFHLAHGFQSAFQSLGVNHPKYTPLIKLVGLLFAVGIGVGFALFPLFWSVGNDGRVPGAQSANASHSVQVFKPVEMSKPHEVLTRSAADLPDVPQPPPGTLEGVDDPRNVSANLLIERRLKSSPPELQPRMKPQK